MGSNDPVKRLAHQLVAEFFGSKVAKVMANLLIIHIVIIFSYLQKNHLFISPYMPISTPFLQSGGCRSCQHKDQDPGPVGHLHTYVLQSGGLSSAPSYLSIFINHCQNHFLEVIFGRTTVCEVGATSLIPNSYPHLPISSPSVSPV